MGKGAGVIAYTKDSGGKDGKILVVYENVYKWSFPKGHRFEDDKTGYKEPWIVNAEREFREETKFPDEIELNLSEEMKMVVGETRLYLFNILEEDTKFIVPDNDEILLVKWVPIDEFEDFRQTHNVNRTISHLNFERFKKMAGFKEKEKRTTTLNPYAEAFVPSFMTSSSASSSGLVGRKKALKKSTKRKSKGSKRRSVKKSKKSKRSIRKIRK